MTQFKLSRRHFIGAAASGLVLPRVPGAFAQSGYPSGNITFIVGYNPGGTSDLIARSFGDEITKETGQTVVVDYRPGGGGGIAGDMVARARADGYMLLAVSNTFYAVTPFLGNVRYDPLADLTPVGFAGDQFNTMSVHPSVPANTLEELIAYGKANPGVLNFASNGQGSLTHLCGEYFKQRTGIEMTHIPYRGAADAIQSTLKGETQVNFSMGDAGYHTRGELRGLATLGESRWPSLPDVPSTTEAGLPDWAIRSWHGVAVPKGTPPEICQQLNEMMNRYVQLPKVIERFATLGLQPGQQTLAQLEERRRQDHAVFGDLIAKAGIVAGSKP
ncbi:tripartite tricarboxylate transporter substrate binding protein [Phyllobacterium sp. 0TCS1.6C]|uniref:Bug family tripartite tricarboxylate transporter substrate binding protein n=1 Tax=unclassified Phyllobacterium TaxID=2638441 RepID=UPI0022644851|nr:MULTISPECIES: tripartite tricarboxylate transporter substrate binding protein [unclassified Phyllobacterium]MCX8279033.1 tripartite tricarboxylate transporter substrate binding protein [Phyllobacterium sp. 0TCS1.6C]MCX8293817.1 tripartite tricarboxylate transporter substrate binding protein [Phyllobacterium sp. 0TCS1.6A]